MIMDFYTISMFLFIALLIAIIWKNRKKVEIQGVLILYRTKKFLRMIDNIAKKSPRVWKIIGSIGIIICFYFMIFGMHYFFQLAEKVAKGEMKESSVKLVLPAPVKSTKIGYAYVFLPFWIWVIVVFFILFPHELAHGIIARAEKVKLKSVGLLLFLIFPGAFVEPDEKVLKRKKLLPKLRVFAAGSFANIVVAFLVFILASFLWQSFVQGMSIVSVAKNSPAEISGLKEGMVIRSINGTRVYYDFGFYSNFVFKPDPESYAARVYLLAILTNWSFSNYSFKPGDKIVIETDKGNFTVTLGKHPKIKNAPYIGIVVGTKGLGLEFLFKLLAILSTLSLAVAVINILPLYPLDGGQMIKALLEEKLGEEKAMDMTKVISFLMLFLILYGVFGPVVLRI